MSFNNNPTDSSFKDVLKTKGREKEVQKGNLYNPFEEMHKKALK